MSRETSSKLHRPPRELEPSCQGRVGNPSTLVRHSATLPDPTEHVELFQQYPTMTNKHKLLAHTYPTVGVSWRLLGQCASCIKNSAANSGGSMRCEKIHIKIKILHYSTTFYFCIAQIKNSVSQEPKCIS